ERPEQPKPGWNAAGILEGSALPGRRSFDEEGDLFWLERFLWQQPAVWISTNATNQLSQFRRDNSLAEVFVSDVETAQVMIVEEVTKRPVADVVQQRGQPHQAFDVRLRRQRLRPTSLAQRRIQVPGCPACQVHRPKHVLEASVFCAWVNPPGALQL